MGFKGELDMELAELLVNSLVCRSVLGVCASRVLSHVVAPRNYATLLWVLNPSALPPTWARFNLFCCLQQLLMNVGLDPESPVPIISMQVDGPSLF